MASVGRNLNRLYVGNIPWTVGNNELKYYFSKFGQIANASVIFDKNSGLSRTYGFVVFHNRTGYDTAINAEHVLEGHTLKVQPAVSGTNNEKY